MDDFDLTQPIGDQLRALAAAQLARDAEEDVPAAVQQLSAAIRAGDRPHSDPELCIDG